MLRDVARCCEMLRDVARCCEMGRESACGRCGRCGRWPVPMHGAGRVPSRSPRAAPLRGPCACAPARLPCDRRRRRFGRRRRRRRGAARPWAPSWAVSVGARRVTPWVVRLPPRAASPGASPCRTRRGRSGRRRRRRQAPRLPRGRRWAGASAQGSDAPRRRPPSLMP